MYILYYIILLSIYLNFSIRPENSILLRILFNILTSLFCIIIVLSKGTIVTNNLINILSSVVLYCKLLDIVNYEATKIRWGLALRSVQFSILRRAKESLISLTLTSTMTCRYLLIHISYRTEKTLGQCQLIERFTVFFHHVIGLLDSGYKKEARILFENLSEPNETCLEYHLMDQGAEVLEQTRQLKYLIA